MSEFVQAGIEMLVMALVVVSLCLAITAHFRYHTLKSMNAFEDAVPRPLVYFVHVVPGIAAVLSFVAYLAISFDNQINDEAFSMNSILSLLVGFVALLIALYSRREARKLSREVFERIQTSAGLGSQVQ